MLALLATTIYPSSIRTTAFPSLMYAHASRRFSQRAAELDNRAVFDAATPPEQSNIDQELREASLATVLMAHGSIEAVVNEFYVDHELPYGGFFRDLDKGLAKRLAAAWKSGVAKLATGQKCDVALAIADRAAINWAAGYAQQWTLLNDLRNTLVHAKPITVEQGQVGADSDDPLERKLCTQFDTAYIWNGLKSAPFRWSGCLGSGCAIWAHKICRGFKKEFFGTLGIDYPKPSPDE